MSTTDTVFLIITASAISLFFLLSAIVLVYIFKLVNSVKQLVAKAEDAIDSVEAATETIKHLGQNTKAPLAAFKIIKNIINLINRHT